MEKNCYKCKFRGTVPGSAHSSCKVLRETLSNESRVFELEMVLSSHLAQMTDQNTGEHLVQLNEHGIKNGWANWPLNFDPVWVESCRFFLEDKKEEVHG